MMPIRHCLTLTLGALKRNRLQTVLAIVGMGVGVFPCQGGGRTQSRHRVAQALRRCWMVMYSEGVVFLVHLHEHPSGSGAAVPHHPR